MTLTGAAARPRPDSQRSAGGQLLQPSEVYNSTTATGPVQTARHSAAAEPAVSSRQSTVNALMVIFFLLSGIVLFGADTCSLDDHRSASLQPLPVMLAAYAKSRFSRQKRNVEGGESML